MKYWLWCLIAFVSLRSEASPPEGSLVNLDADFRVFVHSYRHSDFETQWTGWQFFEKKYARFYSASLCDLTSAACRERRRQKLREFFLQLPSFETRMWDIFGRASFESATVVAKFRNVFPDLTQDVAVVYMPSLLSFNGRGGVLIDGKYTLLIGADLAALRQNNMSVLLSHELFHSYHLARLKGGSEFRSVATPLWIEGLASFASQVLNPDAALDEVLMNRELAEYCARPENVTTLAKEFSEFLDTEVTSEVAEKITAEWFQADSVRLPHRLGYCLSFEVAKKLLAAKKTFSELSEADESVYVPWIRSALRELSER